MSILPNTVINGNCLEIMGTIDSESIDMILCDLPYGVSRNKWDTVIPPDKLWAQYERIIKPHGAILLFGQDKFTAAMMLSNPKLHRYNIIWDKALKSGFLNAKRMPLREHEDIMVFYKSQPPYHPQMTEGNKNHTTGKSAGKQANEVHSNRSYGNHTIVEPSDSTLKYPASIWRFPKPHPSVALHATEKPVELLRYAIRTYTDPGALVLDNCCGCGSTLIAAKLEGRRYIGIDNGVCDKKNSPYFGLTGRMSPKSDWRPQAMPFSIKIPIPITLPMDLRDLALWESGELKAFAIPPELLPPLEDISMLTGIRVGLLEPFKKLTAYEDTEANGKPAKKVITGVLYRSDGKRALMWGRSYQEGYDVAKRWSPAENLPLFAIRREAVITRVETVTLQHFTKEHMRLLCLDYASQHDPQLIMEAIEPDKSFDLLYKWWRAHYKKSLLHISDPAAVILHLAPVAAP